MAQRYGGTAADKLETAAGGRVRHRKVWTYLDAARTVEFTAWYADAALTEATTWTSDANGYLPAVYCADDTGPLYGGAGVDSSTEPTYVAPLTRTDLEQRLAVLETATDVVGY